VRAALYVLVTLLGLAVGSFLNVVIHRVPRNESLLRPRSHCPNCQVTIADRDNIPVVSWLILRGHCRSCGSRISIRYPLVEVATGLLFLGAAFRSGLSWSLPAYLVWVAGLLVLALIDLEHLILPRQIVYVCLALTSALLALASFATHDWHRFVVGLIAGAIWFVVFFALNFASPRLLGFGDVRLAPLLGLALGWQSTGEVAIAFFLSNLIGAVIGVSLIAAGKIRRDQPIPYGVFLALGCVATYYAGSLLTSWIHLRGIS
jgi:leader peptidase (prepilin peptidase) / N-methyltransferase